MSKEFSQEFCKINPQFLGKVRFFSSKLLHIFFLSFLSFYLISSKYYQNFLKISITFFRYSPNFLWNFSKYLKPVNFFSVIFLYSFSNFSSYFIKIFTYFHFVRITTKFSQKQGNLYLKFVRIWLITKIYWKFF